MATQINANPAIDYTTRGRPQPSSDRKETSEQDMTTDLASTNYQFRRLKDMLIADGDADEEEENFDGQKIKWKAYTLLRK